MIFYVKQLPLYIENNNFIIELSINILDLSLIYFRKPQYSRGTPGASRGPMSHLKLHHDFDNAIYTGLALK